MRSDDNCLPSLLAATGWCFLVRSMEVITTDNDHLMGWKHLEWVICCDSCLPLYHSAQNKTLFYFCSCHFSDVTHLLVGPLLRWLCFKRVSLRAFWELFNYWAVNGFRDEFSFRRFSSVGVFLKLDVPNLQLSNVNNRLKTIIFFTCTLHSTLNYF